jgi:hypothetical protein
MKVGVLEHSQEPGETPAHWLRSKLADRLVEHRQAIWLVTRRLLKIVVRKTFSQLVSFLRQPVTKGVPMLLPPSLPIGLDLYYPAKNQSGHPHPGFLYACQVAKRGY